MKRLLVSLFFASLAANAKFLPPRRGGDESASPPTFAGRVLAVARGRLTVSVAERTLEVSGLADERVFTQYPDGRAKVADIAVDDEVRVWSRGCRAPRDGKVEAAAVVVLK